LDIGQWTIAIGNPFKQENTVTVGVLSAVGREIPVPGDENGKPFKLTDMMQTDTAINPGNSGARFATCAAKLSELTLQFLGSVKVWVTRFPSTRRKTSPTS
jgi:S1-C subfamily serine protease